MKNFLINVAVILALLFATGSVLFGEHIVPDPIIKNTMLEPLTDEQMVIADVCLGMSDEERNEMAALLVGTIMAQRPEGWLAVQVEIECTGQRLLPYTREYLEQTTGRPIGLM